VPMPTLEEADPMKIVFEALPMPILIVSAWVLEPIVIVPLWLVSPIVVREEEADLIVKAPSDERDVPSMVRAA